jgi:ribonuclease P protein component
LVDTGFGFPPHRRLRTSKEFGQVFADPVRSADRFFTILARPNDVGAARLGLAISRRAAKRAVDRNRLKRIARESFRRKTLPAWDFVVMARPGAAAEPSAALRASLDGHYRKLARRAGASLHG